MNKRQQLLDAILNRDVPVQVSRAIVKSVKGKFCTVALLPDELEIENVSLVAEEDAETWFYAVPAVDSLVLVGCIENEISNMFLIQAGEIAAIELVIDKTKISAKKDAVGIVQDETAIQLTGGQVKIKSSSTTIELTGSKVKIANESTSLKGLFDDLSTLIQNLKVVTAQGPSTALFPDTLAALTQFKAKYPQLLA